MDRRSWLWRRKSSEKSPGETESSGSISSHSERFSDDQACPTYSSHSPEVTSKGVPLAEDNVSVKTLSEKLSAALLNLSAKEDLIKQHAKVAEEAVSGWEKAENEVFTLKKQLEVSVKKNSALDDRVGHLDGALKECMRQLRQGREEQEQKISEAIANKTQEWESTKSELNNQLVELQTQLQNVKTESAVLVDHDLRPRLEAAEKENSALKLELLSKSKELELRVTERDLSVEAAEMASKQHLESIKKLSKHEAECRRLTAMALRASPTNDHKSLTDGQSDSGETRHSDSRSSGLMTELSEFKDVKAFGRNFMVPPVEIDLMDDFLEMEKLVAGSGSDQQNVGGEGSLKPELEAMIERTAELEEKLEKMEAEKVELEMALSEAHEQIKTCQAQIKETEVVLVQQQTELAIANNFKLAAEEKVESCNSKIQAAESQLRVAEAEIDSLLSKIADLESGVEEEHILSAENAEKCRKLEDELLRMNCEAQLRHEAEVRRVSSNKEDLKIKQEKELAVAARKFAECQKTIASLGQQLQSLALVDDLMLDNEKPSELTGESLKHRQTLLEVRF